MRAAASPSPGARLPCRARCAHAELTKQARSSSTGTHESVPGTCARSPLRTLCTRGHKHLNTHTLCTFCPNCYRQGHTQPIAAGLPRRTQQPHPPHTHNHAHPPQSSSPNSAAPPSLSRMAVMRGRGGGGSSDARLAAQAVPQLAHPSPQDTGMTLGSEDDQSHLVLGRA